MPIGAFISSWNIMNMLTFQPSLGHITTFGGHPVNCAELVSCLKHLMSSNIMEKIDKKEKLFRKHLQHKKIKEIRGSGLILSVELENERAQLKKL